MTIMKNLIIPMFTCNLSSKVGQKSQKLPSLIKLLINKYSYSSLSTVYYNQQPKYITSLGKKVRYFSITSNIYNLSKTMSGEGDQNVDFDYSDIVKAQNNENILIIDVRENFEIEETGKLPGSIHIPMGEVTNVLNNLTNQEFEEKFNRKKPDQNSKIVFSCKAGRRSASVLNDVQKLGYKNLHNYAGGWLDWESHQKN